MAAPIKQGIDYFPYDIDMDNDDKLSMIIGEFGIKGEMLWIKMLSYTYKNEGYYFDYKEDVLLKFLRRYNYCGFNLSFIKEVVPRFIKWGLFDQSVYDASQILTSVRIQKTWLDATRKRIGCKIDSKFSLLEISSGIPAEETPKKAEVIDKEKEKKEKEIKEESIGAIASPTDKSNFISSIPENENQQSNPEGKKKREKRTRANFIAPTQEEVFGYMMKLKGDATKQNSWPEDRIRNISSKCFNHYAMNGWVQGKGKPIVDWQAACKNWIQNEAEGTFSKAAPVFQNNIDKFPKQKQNLPESSASFQNSAPVAKAPTEEEKRDLEKSFLNSSYTDFLNGNFKVQNMGIGAYDSLKLFNLVKLSNQDFNRILESSKVQRFKYLQNSTNGDDIVLRNNYNAETDSEKRHINMIAKKIAALELFELFKSQGKTIIVE